MRSDYGVMLQSISSLINAHNDLKKRCDDLESEKRYDELAQKRGVKQSASLSHKFICLGKHLVNIDHIINIEVHTRFDNGLELYQHTVHLSNGREIYSAWTPLRVAKPFAEYFHKLLDINHTPDMPQLTRNSGDDMIWYLQGKHVENDVISPTVNEEAPLKMRNWREILNGMPSDSKSSDETSITNIANVETVITPPWTATVLPGTVIMETNKHNELMRTIVQLPYPIRSVSGQMCKRLSLENLLLCSVSNLRLSTRARKGLAAENILTIGRLLDYTEDQLFSVHGFGSDTVNHIQRELSLFGLKLAEEQYDDE